ncbi:hypothetical protein N9B79_00600 [bacterium]|nr:hypothetical protein [bacterium]MDB4506221.1 hypothetical protein [bacterium]
MCEGATYGFDMGYFDIEIRERKRREKCVGFSEFDLFHCRTGKFTFLKWSEFAPSQMASNDSHRYACKYKVQKNEPQRASPDGPTSKKKYNDDQGKAHRVAYDEPSVNRSTGECDESVSKKWKNEGCRCQ